MNVCLEMQGASNSTKNDFSTVNTFLQTRKDPDLNNIEKTDINIALNDCIQKISNINNFIKILSNKIKNIEKNIQIGELERKINRHYEQNRYRK